MCFLFSDCIFSLFIVLGTRGENNSVEDESDWDARTRWMKSSFSRLYWPWIIPICINEGYTVCTTLPTVRSMMNTVGLVQAHDND